MAEFIHATEGPVRHAEFRRYALKRIAAGVLLSVVAISILGLSLGFFGRSGSEQPALEDRDSPLPSRVEDLHAVQPGVETGEATAHKEPSQAHPAQPHPGTFAKDAGIREHAAQPSGSGGQKVRGTAFVRASIVPLDYELNKRFYGWRPNDIVQFTDNVNNFQLGVLEVTRRTAVILAERLSRTGSTASFDIHLERAMNWFMIKADQYWFPSAESRYQDGLDEMKRYLEKLEKGEASFFTRADNIIPLLAAYEDLLGSCDENLVKAEEDDGSPVSFFKADDYFFYSRGVAAAMGTVLEAVLEDFGATLDPRHGDEILHHAIESCHRAKEINPWIVTEASLSGILANHRANMAAPISHARFYLGVLIKTLST